MSTSTSARRPTGRHRSRVSLRRAVTPSVYGLSVPTLVVASIALIGVVGASAATLGGLKTSDLGAGNAAVSIHTSGISVQWASTLSGTSWVLNGITLTTPGADRFAAGEKVSVSIAGTSGTRICEIITTNAATTATLAIARATINSACGTTGIDYATIDRVSVVAVR
jgi:hypothetical protein